MSKPFEIGTLGWTEDDLEDPEIESLWFADQYEIVEGVLTRMAAAYFDGSIALDRLQILIALHQHAAGIPCDFGHEVDFVVNKRRIARPDLMYTTPADQRAQLRVARPVPGQPNIRFGRFRVPPTLIIESVRPGHEAHDRETKVEWYARFGVPNYWILTAFEKSLVCLKLDNGEYVPDVAGEGDVELRPSLFPGLVIPLAKLWQPVVEEG